MRKLSLKPANIITISTKITEYENTILDVIADECNLTKSKLIKIAITKLIEEIIQNDTRNIIQSRLISGYNIVFNTIKEDSKITLDKCISRIRGSAPI
ncbi:MAG: hypothetical protein QXO93_01580 [Acidilobaceae archaeon]